LSIDDTADVVEALKTKYPDIEGPYKKDICYATTNRQEAVKEIAASTDAVFVIGAPNSSNSNRLVEVAKVYGAKKSMLIQRAADLDFTWLDDVKVLGITAGASAPEILVREVVEAISARRNVSVEEITIREENVIFNVPRILRDKADAVA
jgi:4-hydroxy-3-methylbut-2-enyl diphosphate reductase